MKKVRAALVATALPTLGLVTMPAVTAHAATTQHVRAAAATAGAPCYYSGQSVGASPNGNILLFASYSYSPPGCFLFQQLTLAHRMTGLTERVRIRSKNNKLLKQTRLAGTLRTGSTQWRSSPRYGPAKCIYGTLVYNNTSNNYGTTVGVCDSFRLLADSGLTQGRPPKSRSDPQGVGRSQLGSVESPG